MDPLQNQFFQAFLVYVVPLLATGLALLVGWLVAKRAQWWTQAGKSGVLWDGLRMAEELAGKAVAAALTDLQADYRRLVADGVLSKEDVEMLKTRALAILKERLGASGLDFLNRALAATGISAEGFLNTQVSAAISRLSGQDPTAKLTVSTPGIAGPVATNRIDPLGRP